MSFWRKLGDITLGLGDLLHRELKNHGEAAKKVQDATDEELEEMAAPSGFFFGKLPEGYQRFDPEDSAYRDYTEEELEAELEHIKRENDDAYQQRIIQRQYAKQVLEYKEKLKEESLEESLD